MPRGLSLPRAPGALPPDPRDTLPKMKGRKGSCGEPAEDGA
jgi:hypothetical protein